MAADQIETAALFAFCQTFADITQLADISILVRAYTSSSYHDLEYVQDLERELDTQETDEPLPQLATVFKRLIKLTGRRFPGYVSQTTV